MSAGDPIIAPIVSWQGLASLLGALGLGGILTALIQRPSSASAAATASRDRATGEASLIEATATAFTEVTGGLREEIERLQQDAGRLQADLAAAHVRAVELEAQVARLTAELERVTRERDQALEKADAALQRVEMLNGEVRQLQQVLASGARAAGKGDGT